MSLTIAPTSCFTPSVFYDPNHNPLNIPCEGPKVVVAPLQFDTNVNPELTVVVDMTVIATQQQLSCVQSMAVDLSDLCRFVAESGNGSNSILEITGGGINQKISIYMGTGGSGQLIPLSFAAFPLCMLNPPKVMFHLNIQSINPVSGIFALNCFFYNYMSPPFEKSEYFVQQ